MAEEKWEGQKIEGKKGVKSAAATSQGSSVSKATARNPVLWQQCCPCQRGPQVERCPVLLGDTVLAVVTEHALLRLSQVRERVEPNAASGTSASACVAAVPFFCHVGSFLQYVDGIRCIKHSVSVCKERAFLPGVCTSRLFALVMWS